MDPDALRALLAAHPAVAIEPFGTRRGVLCVRATDAARLVADAGHDVDEDELQTAMSVLGGERPVHDIRVIDAGVPLNGQRLRHPAFFIRKFQRQPQ